MASVACATCSHYPETHPGDYNRARYGSDRISPDLLPPLELPGKQYSRLVAPAQSGHESWVCERASRQLGTGQTSGGVGGASSPPGTPGAGEPHTPGLLERPGSTPPRASSGL